MAEQIDLDGQSLIKAWVLQTNFVAQAVCKIHAAHNKHEEDVTQDDVALLNALSTALLALGSEQRRARQTARQTGAGGLLLPG